MKTILFAVLFVTQVGIGFAQSKQNADCLYHQITDKKEIVIREKDERLQEIGKYHELKTTPNFSADGLPYKPYAGKRGKIIEKFRESGSEYYKILLENCEYIYAYISPVLGDRQIDGIYYVEDSIAASKLISTPIFINQDDHAYRKLTLITEDKNVSYEVEDMEKVTVTGIFTKALGHSYGIHPFYLEVEKSNGEKGFIGYNEKNFNTIDSAIHHYKLTVTDLDSVPLQGATIYYALGKLNKIQGQSSYTTENDGEFHDSVTFYVPTYQYRTRRDFKSFLTFSIDREGYYTKTGKLEIQSGNGSKELDSYYRVVKLTRPIDVIKPSWASTKEGKKLTGKIISVIDTIVHSGLFDEGALEPRSIEPIEFKGKKYLRFKFLSYTTKGSQTPDYHDISRMNFNEIVKKALPLLSPLHSVSGAFQGYEFTIMDHLLSLSTTSYDPMITLENRFILPIAAVKQFQAMDITAEKLLAKSIILMNNERIEFKSR